MKNVSSKLIICALLFFSAIAASAQDVSSAIQEYLDKNFESMHLSAEDVANWVITDDVTSPHNGVRHVHIAQTFDGILVKNATANVTLINGNEVVQVANRLVANLKSRITGGAAPGLSADVAIQKAAGFVDMTGAYGAAIPTNEPNHFKFEKGTLAKEDVSAKLAFWKTDESVELVWIVSLYQNDGEHWWQVFINANSGKEIDRLDWVVRCNFPTHAKEPHAHNPEFAIPYVPPMPPPAGIGQYNVFALPVESPSHGGRTLEISPADTVSSPYGWHDTNGVYGPEYTTTRGNNVHAYSDVNDANTQGYIPDGGPTLDFDFPMTFANQPIGYQDAAITNLFFTCNRIHDMLYSYGFNEAFGNFQENNYGNGGLGSDYVIAEAQDGGGTNNANFATPDDGNNGRMQMYLWTGGSAGPFELLTINSPAAIAGTYMANEPFFGPGLTLNPITDDFAVLLDDAGDPTDACDSVLNGPSLVGKIVVLRRGTCGFPDKVMKAQDEGAIAVVIVNNVPGIFGPGGNNPLITIPSIFIDQAPGDSIIARLLAGQTVNGTIVADSSAGNDRDGDLDNGIIAHEYGHGISNRMTGGPNNSSCLFNDEQMGEGWSDFFAVMLTMDTSIANPVYRPIGTYASYEQPNGIGIRNAPYDTSFAVNAFTYGDVANTATISQPHGVGFVWATMLWDLNWAFIDLYGYDANIDSGSGGNNMVMQLVMDGMALQPCGPGFVDGRDAILLADELNYGGVNKCLIWEVFARRGLGASSDQGSSSSRTDGTEAFDIPTLCQTPIVAPKAAFDANFYTTCTGEIQFEDLSTDVPHTWLWDFGDGNTDSVQHPSHVYTATGLYTVSLTVSNIYGADTETTVDFIDVNFPLPPTATDGSGCSSDSILLTANGSATIGWFDGNGNWVGTGNNFYAPPSQTTTTYYARNGQTFPISNVGPVDTAIGSGNVHGSTFTGTVDFTTEKDVTIYSAWVFSGGAGQRTVSLWNQPGGVGTVLQTINVDIPFAGAGRVDLGFEVPGAGSYSIGLDQADLYRNDGGVNYPYTIPGLMSITGSSAGSDYYYYFYDLEVSETPCWSDSVPAIATVTDTVDFTFVQSSLTLDFTDISPGANDWSWDFGDGNVSTLQNPSHTYAAVGFYDVTLTINGGLCSVTYTINVGGVGIEEVEGLYFTMQPNPAEYNTHITLSRSLTSSAVLKLYTLDGKLVKETTVEAGQRDVVLQVGEFSSNLYLLVLEHDGGVVRERLVVLR